LGESRLRTAGNVEVGNGGELVGVRTVDPEVGEAGWERDEGEAPSAFWTRREGRREDREDVLSRSRDPSKDVDGSTFRVPEHAVT